ncbi:MAG: hypothetical protein BJ554DRAFT_3365 [Olpidium bornovanus]|uniref:HTH CENPB-type domain-containing protein n=1 Tax=Olpidium bornovanus TaxID=278681 RepID=A0A8H8DFW6_9FUNG|nr:MAG: hypothetical protein BJ554DRAFT_3365 [Olpidium bornovanus]
MSQTMLASWSKKRFNLPKRIHQATISNIVKRRDYCEAIDPTELSAKRTRTVQHCDGTRPDAGTRGPDTLRATTSRYPPSLLPPFPVTLLLRYPPFPLPPFPLAPAGYVGKREVAWQPFSPFPTKKARSLTRVAPCQQASSEGTSAPPWGDRTGCRIHLGLVPCGRQRGEGMQHRTGKGGPATGSSLGCKNGCCPPPSINFSGLFQNSPLVSSSPKSSPKESQIYNSNFQPSQYKHDQRPQYKHPVMEDAVAPWVHQCQSCGVALTEDLIRMKAKTFAQSFNIHPESVIEFSAGWLHNFQQPHQLHSARIHSDGGFADNDVIEDALPGLRATIAKYSLCDIFNMDETGPLPRRSRDKARYIPVSS